MIQQHESTLGWQLQIISAVLMLQIQDSQSTSQLFQYCQRLNPSTLLFTCELQPDQELKAQEVGVHNMHSGKGLDFEVRYAQLQGQFPCQLRVGVKVTLPLCFSDSISPDFKYYLRLCVQSNYCIPWHIMDTNEYPVLHFYLPFLRCKTQGCMYISVFSLKISQVDEPELACQHLLSGRSWIIVGLSIYKNAMQFQA